MQDPKRPLLRYPGGKWRIAKWIIAQFPPHRQYVEPYGGGGSVLLRKPRVHHEVYNDISSEVVNVFRVMQDSDTAQKLISKLKMTPFSREEYYLSREDDPDPVEQARRTIIRTFMGFGTTSCFNRTSGFRASSFYENRSTGTQWIDHSEFLEVYIGRLKGVIIENRPAIQVMEQQDKREDTLFYCDPPYVKSTRYQEDIYEVEMDDQDHRDLADFLHGVGGMVAISGYHSELYDELYADWDPREKTAFASAPSGVNERTEVLWLNPACRKNLYPLFNGE